MALISIDQLVFSVFAFSAFVSEFGKGTDMLFSAGGKSSTGAMKSARYKWIAGLLSCLLMIQVMMAGAVFGEPANSSESKSPAAFAAPGVKEDIRLDWVNRSAKLNSLINRLIAAPGGGYVGVGWIATNEGGKMLIQKFDELGNSVWHKGYGGMYNNWLVDVTATRDGGYAAVGVAPSDVFTSWIYSDSDNMFVAKFNKTGDKIWSKMLKGSSYDLLFGITAAPDWGYVVVGCSASGDGDLPGAIGVEDMVIVRFDENGNRVWTKRYGSLFSDRLYSVVPAPDGGFVAVGDADATIGDFQGKKGLQDMVIAKFDRNGNKVWMKSYGGSKNDSLYRIALSNDGGYIAVGESQSDDGDLEGNNGASDMVIAKFDRNGDKVWIKSVGGKEWESLSDVIAVPEWGYVAVGDSPSGDGDMSGNKGSSDMVIARFDEGGNLVWMGNFGGSRWDGLTSVALRRDGGYMAAGESHSADGDFLKASKMSGSFIAKFSEVDPVPPIRSIEIKRTPAKTAWTEGELLDLAGLNLQIRYEDDTVEPLASYVTTPAAGTALKTTDTKITVSWRGYVAEIPITVGKAVVPKLTVTNTEGGSFIKLPPFNMGLKAGSAVTIIPLPQTGYRLARWEVTGIPGPATTVTLEFTMPAVDVTVKAVFERISQAKITVTTQGRGIVLGSPPTAPIGSSITMLAVPLWPLSRLDHWEVNGANAGNGLILSHLVTGDVTIRAVFK